MYRKRRTLGYSAVELAIALAVAATALSVTTAKLQTVLRRARVRSSVQEVYSLVLATRMQAIKRNQQVVLFVDTNKRQIVTWADKVPYNYVQDTNEPALNRYSIPPFVYFRAPSGGGLDSAASVAFDTYEGNSSRKNLVVFRGDGTLVAPQSADSLPPTRPTSYSSTVPSGSALCSSGCRGIYIADRSSGGNSYRNLFRISVDDFGRTGRASLLKWLPAKAGGKGGADTFVPSPWTWYD
jgi:Tfp pilus assembly protein FimT